MGKQMERDESMHACMLTCVHRELFRGGSKVFRTVNFELFAKGNKVIAIGGSLLLLASLTVISNMNSGKSKAASRKQDF